MNFAEFATQFASAFDIDPAVAEQAGGFSIQIDNANTMHIEQAAGGDLIHLYSPVCRIPSANSELFLRRLLEAHAFGYATAGATFGIHPEHENVLLFQTFSLRDMDEDSLVNILGSFQNQVQFWASTLLNMNLPSADSPPAPFEQAV